MGRRANKRPDLNGVLVIDKPLGMTTATICSVVRGKSGGAKVGHAGTLDPLATGVVVVCLGKACKLSSRLMALPKRYLAGVDLSANSTTDDLEGELTQVEVKAPPTRADLEAATEGFVGEIMQAPPIYSAISVGGKRAYKLARAGEISELPPRAIVVHAIEVVEYEWPLATLDIRCGKGTYIRSLARDLGASLGAGGVLRSLCRLSVGDYSVEAALSLDDLREPIAPDELLPLPQENAKTPG